MDERYWMEDPRFWSRFIMRRTSLAYGLAGLALALSVGLFVWQQARPASPELDLQLLGSKLFSELREGDITTRAKLAILADALEKQENRVDRLSTEDLHKRIADLQGKLDDVAKQYESLRQIVNPSSAEEILTVARMKDEILAREGFEQSLTGKMEAYESRITGIEQRLGMRLESAEGRVSTTQYWIWGQLVALLGVLGGAIWFLLKRMPAVGRIIR